MKKIITLLLWAIGTQTFAQSFSDGVYSTNFGTINLTFEQGFEYPNGGIVYGDYKGIGTITGSTTNVGKEIVGSFHNGAAEGKFIFFSPTGKQHFFDSGITSFNGNWGYEIDNKYSTNPDYIWKVTNKTAGKDAIKNVTNVWSGKWNTTQGYIILQQVGNKVTGKYHDVGTIEATYNASTKKLTGTFTNKGQKGHLEFTFEGNSFKGKWGWTTAMTGGNWNGDKHVKNNKVIATTSTSTNVQQGLSSNSNNQNPVQDDFIKIRVRAVYAEGRTSDGITFKGNLDLYGFVRFELKKLTASSSTLVKSFGDKSKYLFEKTEDSPLIVRARSYQFPNEPTYYRDYIISKSDWENNNIQFELTVGHHLKVVAVGSNLFCEKQNEIISLKKANILNKQHRTRNDSDSARYVGGCFLDFYIEKLN